MEGNTMTILALITITQVVATWTNILMIIGSVFLCVIVTDRLRRVLTQTGLDAIQLYSGYRMAWLDTEARRLAILEASDRARLAIREQRLLLGRMEE
jgi:hypothetical protein